MTRGYLGEYAFARFLSEKWEIESELGHQMGVLAEYLPTDIHQITRRNEQPRPPRLGIGIKTTKWNGIWLDIPGDQFNHSDIHVLIKVGTGRTTCLHFLRRSAFSETKCCVRVKKLVQFPKTNHKNFTIKCLIFESLMRTFVDLLRRQRLIILFLTRGLLDELVIQFRDGMARFVPVTLISFVNVKE